MSKNKIEISIVTYNDGKFDVMLQDPETFERITLSGEQTFNKEELEYAGRIAPPCVFSTYGEI